MAAKMEKTKTPGIFKRGSRYVVTFRDAAGRQRRESARTLDDARRLKAARTTAVATGEYQERSRDTLHAYSREWVKRYQGRGRRGFRENTRDEYTRTLEQYVFNYFPERTSSRRSSPRTSPSSSDGCATPRRRAAGSPRTAGPPRRSS